MTEDLALIHFSDFVPLCNMHNPVIIAYCVSVTAKMLWKRRLLCMKHFSSVCKPEFVLVGKKGESHFDLHER